jgi:hypothetical protein
MDPPAQDINQAQIEVRIESFLRDTSKIYVETQFMWPFSPPHGSSFEARERLDQVNNFATHEVRNFITGESDD